jgi:hypothetical protein
MDVVIIVIVQVSNFITQVILYSTMLFNLVLLIFLIIHIVNIETQDGV